MFVSVHIILTSFKGLFEGWEMVPMVGVRHRLGVRHPACVCVCVWERELSVERMSDRDLELSLCVFSVRLGCSLEPPGRQRNTKVG